MKSSMAAIVVTFIVSLGIWTAFSLTAYPLDQLSTVVVVGVVALVVFGARSLIMKARKSRSDMKAETKTATAPAKGEGETHG